MSDYNQRCIVRQPQGVKPEEAGHFCNCKTVGLNLHFSSPSSAERAVHPVDRDRTDVQQYLLYLQVVDICVKGTRKIYGRPDVALDTGISR